MLSGECARLKLLLDESQRETNTVTAHLATLEEEKDRLSISFQQLQRDHEAACKDVRCKGQQISELRMASSELTSSLQDARRELSDTQAATEIRIQALETSQIQNEKALEAQAACVSDLRNVLASRDSSLQSMEANMSIAEDSIDEFEMQIKQLNNSCKRPRKHTPT